jgi:lysozyme
MKTGANGERLIKESESLHDGDLSLIGLQPKMCPAGIWTEGYGRAMRDDKGEFIKGIANKALAFSRISIHNEIEASKALAEDLGPREQLVMQKIKTPLTQNKFDALVVLFYNIGFSDTLTKLINTNASKEAIEAWWTTHYVTGQGNPKPLPGLVLRRKKEVNLFFS